MVLFTLSAFKAKQTFRVKLHFLHNKTQNPTGLNFYAVSLTTLFFSFILCRLLVTNVDWPAWLNVQTGNGKTLDEYTHLCVMVRCWPVNWIIIRDNIIQPERNRLSDYYRKFSFLFQQPITSTDCTQTCK